MSRKKILQKKEEKQKAREQLPKLFDNAKSIFKEDKKKANDYVRKARNLAMKYRIRLPKELKMRFCKHCYSYTVPGVNCRVRNDKGRVVYFCEECKHYTRYPYIKEQKEKRKKNTT